MNIITDISDALGLSQGGGGKVGDSQMSVLNKLSSTRYKNKKKDKTEWQNENHKSKLMEPLKFEKDFFR